MRAVRGEAMNLIGQMIIFILICFYSQQVRVPLLLLLRPPKSPRFPSPPRKMSILRRSLAFLFRLSLFIWFLFVWMPLPLVLALALAPCEK